MIEFVAVLSKIQLIRCRIRLHERVSRRRRKLANFANRRGVLEVNATRPKFFFAENRVGKVNDFFGLQIFRNGIANSPTIRNAETLPVPERSDLPVLLQEVAGNQRFHVGKSFAR